MYLTQKHTWPRAKNDTKHKIRMCTKPNIVVYLGFELYKIALCHPAALI